MEGVSTVNIHGRVIRALQGRKGYPGEREGGKDKSYTRKRERKVDRLHKIFPKGRVDNVRN